VKILQLVQKPQRRGAEIFAYQLSQELRQHKHTVRTVYLYTYQGAEPLPLQDQDCLLAGRQNHPSEKIFGLNPHLLHRLRQLIDKVAPDVVQVNGARTVKYGAFAKRSSRARQWQLIYRNIDDPTYWLRDPLRRWFYKRLVMPQVDGIVGVSRATLRNVQTLYRSQAQTIYIPNGIDTKPLQHVPSRTVARKAVGIAPDVAVLLFMGNLTTQKRPDRFLRVVQKLRALGHMLEGWILGDGPLRQEVENQAKALNILDSIRFWGYQAQIGSYVAAADILLVTSDSDGIPAVVLEAGFIGVPVVAGSVGGLAECILHEKTGMLVQPHDEAKLVEAVRSLLQHPDRRTGMGIEAREFIRNHFTMDIIAARYAGFYEQILRSRG
jgi:glycosyltransferase involved in cell wall biosynthesis